MPKKKEMMTSNVSSSKLSAVQIQMIKSPNISVPKQDDTVGEKMQKVEFRSLDRSNTRLNINNVNHGAMKEKRERAINYWKDRVIQDFLPSINETRKRNNPNDKSVTVEAAQPLSKIAEFKIPKNVSPDKKVIAKYPSSSSSEEYEDFDDAD